MMFLVVCGCIFLLIKRVISCFKNHLHGNEFVYILNIYE
jgi:hypothetical protein